MSQKINPTSLRLGLTQVWDSKLQNYGKLYGNYSIILHIQLQINQLLIQFFNFNNILLGLKQFHYSNDKVLLGVFYSNLTQNSSSTKDALIHFSKLIPNWIRDKISVYFYLKPRWFSTVDLIFSYVQHLLKKNVSLNKIFWNLCRILETQLNSKRVICSTYGPIRGELEGFRIHLSGRFDNSRNQMAKNIKYKSGSLSLMTLQSHVEFINTEIHTKLGTCGLQLWLFYKIH